jgi:RNA polymerase sigma-70 factor (ECF subfamily)
VPEIEELYRLYGRDVYGYIYSLTRDRFVSEDLSQETFLAAIRGIGGYKGDCSVRTWLFSIARRKWYNHLRKNKTRSETAILSDIISRDDVEGDYINAEKARFIEGFIAQKDEKTRRVMALRIEGFSFSEIAGKLGLSESSARVIFHRCKASIIKHGKEKGYE